MLFGMFLEPIGKAYIKFKNSIANDADEMMVVGVRRVAADEKKALPVVAVHPADEPGPHEPVENAIDGRKTYPDGKNAVEFVVYLLRRVYPAACVQMQQQGVYHGSNPAAVFMKNINKFVNNTRRLHVSGISRKDVIG